MNILRAVAFAIGLVSLVGSVLAVRREGGFPLLTLGRRWLGTPVPGQLMFGALVGVASVALVPLVGGLAGAVHIQRTEAVTLAWLGLAGASLLIKALFVLFEELVFRGSLCSQLGRVSPPLVAIVVSAAVFASAHTGRPPLGLTILWIDGIGFAAAFLALGNLWLPLGWHLAKNATVWFVYGAGTLQMAPGPFRVHYLQPGWLAGSVAGPGVADLVVSGVLVGVVILVLSRRDS